MRSTNITATHWWPSSPPHSETIDVPPHTWKLFPTSSTADLSLTPLTPPCPWSVLAIVQKKCIKHLQPAGPQLFDALTKSPVHPLTLIACNTHKENTPCNTHTRLLTAYAPSGHFMSAAAHCNCCQYLQLWAKELSEHPVPSDC